MGLTILPKFDPWGEAGQQMGQGIGSGINAGMDILTQRKMIGSATDKLRTQLANPNANPLETFVDLTTAFAGIPGGTQLVQEAFPILRQEMIRQGSMRGFKSPQGSNQEPGTPIGESEAKPSQAPVLSLEQKREQSVSGKVAAGMPYEQAVAATNQELQLDSQEQQRRQSAQQFAMQKRDDLTNKAFPKGVSEPTRKYIARQADALIERGVPVEAAFSQVFPNARAMQLEDEKLLEVVKRPGFLASVPESNFQRIRVAAPRLIKEDPEYVMGKLQEIGYGPAEAARVVRPGSKEFSQLEQKFSKLPPYIEYKPELGLRAEVTNPKTLQALEAALNKFDTASDSLAVWRAAAFDQGITESTFRELVQKRFPDGKGLSDFNLRELPILSEVYQPPMSEIFGDIIGLRMGEAISKAGRNIRAQIGKKR